MESKNLHIAKKVVANIARFLLAALFVFSGFVKLVDPIGGMYKIQDYFIAFGLADIFPNIILLILGTGVAVLEFTLGTCLLLGIRRKLSTWLSLLLMIFMTGLTLFLAVTDGVSNCGCFGDVLVLSNWETFYKNIFLLLLAILVFKWKHLIIPFISYKSQWLVSLYTFLYGVGLAVYCLIHLPVLDFRPFKIGKNILTEMSIPDGADLPVYETYFTMEKDGERKEFTLADYPDATWNYVDARTELVKKGFEPSIHDFTLLDYRTGDDITERVLQDSTYNFLLVANRLDKADDSNIDLINEIFDYAAEHGYGFYCLTSSSGDDLETWQDRTGAEYPFVQVDDITLKTIIRSNPGLMLIKDGTILNKWNDNDIPLVDELDPRGLDYSEVGQMALTTDLHVVGFCILWYFIPLLLVMGGDLIWVYHTKRKTRKVSEKDLNKDSSNPSESLQ